MMKFFRIFFICLVLASCVPSVNQRTENKTVPSVYTENAQDTTNSAYIDWKVYFNDPNLTDLIQTALSNNQEFNIVQQEIVLAQNEMRARKGLYLPFVSVGAGTGAERQGRYTRYGAIDANTEIAPGKKIPDPLTDLLLGANLTWEVDIWKKLRNSRKAAMHRFFASQNGRNFLQTILIAEIANSYYELMALDNQLEILRRNIQIQQNALHIVQMQKDQAKVTELAVRRFEAEVLKNQSRQYDIIQQIIVTENHINFMVGRFPQPVQRNSQAFPELKSDSVLTGIPTQLLAKRPDIIQAEQELMAAKLDVKAARANFYPSFFINAGVGVEAFNANFLVKSPESILYYFAGQLVGPLINRNGIKAQYYSANARQIQAVYNYERKILNGYIEVSNQLSNISNLQKSYELKNMQVQTLTRSIDISTGLFNSARADYMEVLLTQRDALEARFELIEIKKRQMNARVNIYQALGGGW